jgi:hypothetical protein
MKYYSQETISRLQEIQLLEDRAIQLAKEVSALRQLGKSEGLNYMCDSTVSIMMNKTNELLKPLKPE